MPKTAPAEENAEGTTKTPTKDVGMELIDKHKEGATEFPIDLDVKSAKFIRDFEKQYEKDYGKE